MNVDYFPIITGIGVNGLNIAAGMNEYFDDYNIKLKAKWCTKEDGMLDKIENMLQRDIPVTFSIGPILGKDGVSFYDWSPQEGDKYNFVIETYPYKMHGHYVTVTGMVIDDVKNETHLKISSLGRTYYINYEE